jgi:hypothetical protein
MNWRSHLTTITSRLLSAVAVACLLAVFAAPVAATSPRDGKRPERRVPEADSPDAAVRSSDAPAVLRKTSIDPETGEITATVRRLPGEALSAPLANALSRSTEGLRVFTLANGGHGVDLAGRFQHVLVVRMKADGSLETACVNHPHEAEHLLHGGSAAGKTEPKDR